MVMAAMVATVVMTGRRTGYPMMVAICSTGVAAVVMTVNVTMVITGMSICTGMATMVMASCRTGTTVMVATCAA